MKMRQCSKVLTAVMLPIVVQGVKIAFVGDTGMDGKPNVTSTMSKRVSFLFSNVFSSCILFPLVRRILQWIWPPDNENDRRRGRRSCCGRWRF